MSAVRVYPDGQLTLPEEASSALQVKEGDFLEVSTVGDMVILKPARKSTHIFPHGTPEAEEEYRQSERDFAEGRYRTFDSVESFADYLGVPLSEAQASSAESPVDNFVVGAIKLLVEEALSASLQGDPATAAEFLEKARRSLEGKDMLSVPRSRSSSP